MFEETERRIIEKYNNGLPIDYSDVAEIVEYLINIKLNKANFVIPGYDLDDVAQELRLKCWNVIKHFRPGVYTAYNFLGRCIDNHIRDIMRRYTVRRSNTCFYCLYYDKDECRLYKDPTQCPRYRRYIEMKKRKENVSFMKIGLDELADQISTSDVAVRYEDKIVAIRNYLSPDGAYLFECYLAGSGLSNKDYERLYEEVRYVVERYIE
ncbi:MAG: hypothetical protein DRP85_00700 [Candidatus Makaraimicrobium thalassicum]|nr:MAG: hypothetical protein DRP85_00700 [Candidatus Omnitrophota bacterium]